MAAIAENTSTMEEFLATGGTRLAPTLNCSRQGIWRTREFALKLISIRENGTLLADTKGRKNPIQDVVGGGCPSDAIKRSQCRVEVEQEHLVRNSELGCRPRLL